MSIFEEQYKNLLLEIIYNGERQKNIRTGHNVIVSRTGADLEHEFVRDLLPMPGNRRYYPHIAAAEALWMLMGIKDPSFIMKHAPKMWGKFLEDGELPASYGYRLRKAFGRDQIAEAVATLRSDPSNRQVFLSVWDPRVDGLGQTKTKNVPCPVAFSLYVINGKLNLNLIIRSSDVYVGLIYDALCYSFLMKFIADELDLALGMLEINTAHTHLYDVHIDLVNADLSKEWSRNTQIKMPSGLPKGLNPTWEEADAYVQMVKDEYKLVFRPENDPKPFIVA
jgi:thymidylate synthase